MPTYEERIEGALLGLLVGDALGVPYEFHEPEDIPPLAKIEMEPPRGFRRAHPAASVGAWSDDGAQALCLLESLLHVGSFDVGDFARRMVSWLERGHLAVDGHVFDVGVQTSRALRSIAQGKPILEAAPTGENTNGNGALMRVLPLALFHDGTDAELVRDARLSSCPTHPHVRSQVACALACLYARSILDDRDDPWADAVTRLRAVLDGDGPARSELDTHVRPDEPPHGSGSGYVVDCLHSARLALAAGPYETAVRTAIALGDDTDTTACVAGGLAGLRDGVQAIPARWRAALRGRELLDPLLAGLLERVARRAP
ncbi:MAG: ADP-ribosylglycohydrolase family protein [Polyangiales bacterium]